MNAFQTFRPEGIAATAREFPVNLYQAEDDDTWIAECDDLPLATEAPSVEALIERVWAIAPEIAALNGHRGDLSLRFVVHTRSRA